MQAETIQVIIETPKGSRQKYHYDEHTRVISLKKVLPQGMVFPFDFGLVPQTKGEDGDPLDILLLSEFSSFPGCQLECKLIGGIKAKQSEGKKNEKKIRNDRIFAIPVLSEVFNHIQKMSDIPGNIMNETEQFFIQYNKLDGKSFEILGKMKANEVMKLINESRQQ